MVYYFICLFSSVVLQASLFPPVSTGVAMLYIAVYTNSRIVLYILCFVAQLEAYYERNEQVMYALCTLR